MRRAAQSRADTRDGRDVVDLLQKRLQRFCALAVAAHAVHEVAAYLLSEAARAHSLTFSIPFSRIQLADYLNCDRSALSRELSTMQKEGLIDTYRSSFKLLEPDALQQMVQ